MAGGLGPAIALTENALKHLNKMRSERNEDLRLRIGVKQGGCSGMSYTMEFETNENSRPDDSVMEYNGFVIGKNSSSLYDIDIIINILNLDNEASHLITITLTPATFYDT